jgi:hypothetical protein
MTDNEIFDQLDWAFDQMEVAMGRLKEAGYDGMAREYGSRWVEVNDAFHEERVNGGDGNRALSRMDVLEDEIIEALRRLRILHTR